MEHRIHDLVKPELLQPMPEATGNYAKNPLLTSVVVVFSDLFLFEKKFSMVLMVLLIENERFV